MDKPHHGRLIVILVIIVIIGLLIYRGYSAPARSPQNRAPDVIDIPLSQILMNNVVDIAECAPGPIAVRIGGVLEFKNSESKAHTMTVNHVNYLVKGGGGDVKTIVFDFVEMPGIYKFRCDYHNLLDINILPRK